MKRLKNAVVNSFTALRKCPKLFLPKILIAAVYSLPMLGVARLTLGMVQEPLAFDLSSLWFWVAFLFCALLLDIFVNAMYSVLAEQFRKSGTISFRAALGRAKERAVVVLPSVLAVLAVDIVVLVAVVFAVTLALVLPMDVVQPEDVAVMYPIVFICGTLAIFATSVVFFMVLPIASLEGRGIAGTIGRSVGMVRKNAGEIAAATLLVFAVSLSGQGLAFATELLAGESAIIALVLFIIARLLTAIFSTYAYILNPAVYLEFAGAGIKRAGKALK